MQVHLAIEDQRQGPFSIEEINQKLSEKKLRSEGVLAWYEGGTDWVPLAEVPGVAISPPSRRMPLPPPLPRHIGSTREPFQSRRPEVGQPSGAGQGNFRPKEEGDATGGVIPYKNPHALTAYYLGIFGLFPVLGVLLAIPAVILGISGLRKRKRNPIIKGSVHAWIGIGLSCISLLYNGLIIFFIGVGLILGATQPAP